MQVDVQVDVQVEKDANALEVPVSWIQERWRFLSAYVDFATLAVPRVPCDEDTSERSVQKASRRFGVLRTPM